MQALAISIFLSVLVYCVTDVYKETVRQKNKSNYINNLIEYLTTFLESLNLLDNNSDNEEK